MKFLLRFFLVLCIAGGAYASDLTEQQKISALLDAIGNSDITFIRNGEAHDGKYAKSHLEEKLKEARGVEKAEDFIKKIASASSHTGEPYLIQLKDGRKLEASQWFHERLKEIEDTKIIE